jgi:pyruvate dehydrogenase E1 component beta subunit
MAIRNLTYAEALREALRQEMESDDSVVVMGEDIAQGNGLFRVTEGLWKQFGGRRVINTPISEGGFAGVGIGAAIYGLKPVVEFQVFDFIMLAMDQIANAAAKMCFYTGGQLQVPVVFRGPCGFGSGFGITHTNNLEDWFVQVPGLKVVMPSNPGDAKGLLISSIRDPNPVVFIEHVMLYYQKGPVDDSDAPVPLGVAAVAREGKDVTIVATSWCVSKSLEAASILNKDGIDVEIIDIRTLKPLDIDSIVNSVKKTGLCLIVNESNGIGGFSSELYTVITENAFKYLKDPVKRVYGKDVHGAPSRALEMPSGVLVEEIVQAARALKTPQSG